MNTLKNTTLNVGLMSTPVKLMNATSKMGDINFKTVGPDGQPVERIYRDKATKEEIKHDNLRKSYENKMVSKADLARIEEASTKDGDLDLTQINVSFFMPMKDVPMERVEDLYYLAPNHKVSTPESLLHFMEGIKKRKVAAVAKIVVKSRQKLLVIFHDAGILKAVSLRFEEAIVPANEEVEINGKPKKAIVDMMGTLIDSTMGSMDDLRVMEDDFITHKRELVEALIADGAKPEIKETKPADDAPKGLMEALEASVKAHKGDKKVAA